MTAIDKAVSSDITLGQLLDGLAAAPEAPLVFLYCGFRELTGRCSDQKPDAIPT